MNEYEQTSNISATSISCPGCGTPFGNKAEIISMIFNEHCYDPENIPGELVFTCFNEECEMCDDDFTFIVSIAIHLQHKE